MEEEKAIQIDGISYLIRGDKVRLLEQWLKDNCCGAAAVGTQDGYMKEVDEAESRLASMTQTASELNSRMIDVIAERDKLKEAFEWLPACKECERLHAKVKARDDIIRGLKARIIGDEGYEEFLITDQERAEMEKRLDCKHQRTGYVSTMAGRRCLDCWEAVGERPHGVITYDEKDVMRLVDHNARLQRACWDALSLNENPRRDGKDEEEWQDTMRNIRAALNPGCWGLPSEPER